MPALIVDFCEEKREDGGHHVRTVDFNKNGRSVCVSRLQIGYSKGY